MRRILRNVLNRRAFGVIVSRRSWIFDRRAENAVKVDLVAAEPFQLAALGAERATLNVEPPVQAEARMRELPSQARNGIV